MSLSDAAVRALQPGAKAYKRGDAQGLYLLVAPTGARLWRLNYRVAGRQKTLAIGAYPTISLHDAREARDAAKRQLRQGIDPAAALKVDKAVERQNATTFAIVAADWLQRKVVAEGKATSTTYRAGWLVDQLNDGLGSRPIAEIEAPELLDVLRRIEAGGKHETVKRLRATASSIFRFAIATGVAKRDIAADLRGALTSVKSTPRAAIIDPIEVGKLLRAIDGIEKPGIRLPLQLLALVFTRPGELCAAEWSEFDLDAGTWTIPAAKMKMRHDFRLPLSKQALAILKELRAAAGKSRWVFPNRHADRHISSDKLIYALRKLGYSADEVSSHGFRSTASTILNESGKFSVDAIELSLAHQPGGVRALYNRSTLWPERAELVQWYADCLDELRARGDVVALPAAKKRGV